MRRQIRNPGRCLIRLNSRISNAIIFGVLVGATLFPVNASASLLDAFVLAVDHFDPNHEAGLELDSPEVQFMKQALEKAREAIPEVVGIHVRTDGAGSYRLLPTMFRTLEFVDRNALSGNPTLTPEHKSSVAAIIGSECRVEIETNERIGSNRSPLFRRSTLWTFDNDCDDGTDLEMCADHEILRWLCSRGVRDVLLIENSYKGKNRGKFYLRFAQVVDLEFKSTQLMADPLYLELFGNHSLAPYLGGLVGDGNSLEILPDDEHAGFDGVVIKFTVGFGDCPSGCIYSHNWIFKFWTQGNKDGDSWPLVGGLVEEGGTPIPEHMRAQLRSAEPIR